jgi:hypothetical protein
MKNKIFLFARENFHGGFILKEVKAKFERKNYQK